LVRSALDGHGHPTDPGARELSWNMCFRKKKPEAAPSHCGTAITALPLPAGQKVRGQVGPIITRGGNRRQLVYQKKNYVRTTQIKSLMMINHNNNFKKDKLNYK